MLRLQQATKTDRSLFFPFTSWFSGWEMHVQSLCLQGKACFLFVCTQSRSTAEASKHYQKAKYAFKTNKRKNPHHNSKWKRRNTRTPQGRQNKWAPSWTVAYTGGRWVKRRGNSDWNSVSAPWLHQAVVKTSAESKLWKKKYSCYVGTSPFL